MSFVTAFAGVFGVTLIAYAVSQPELNAVAAGLGGFCTVLGFLGWPE